ncbi:rhomboid family intramembrane serine protease [Ktedonosporobacter rubrisoli]|uniref:Rhomboid family intramembrane serine protease n=1 Tax=Ktedonosporobacter rubrisoli TaxID=2509675 RepID=A0A4P6JUU8_KTERU|nr:rhomboid family intramembrane serine protease [Ktedonosporobacter rubrisoli]QBD79155.1 rhomboid family intramembrane serine protease [Ktedonosporobacter rubrisoli]
MFLHDGILHIGLNMLSLYFIGPAVEITYGKVRYLAIYLISGIMGGVLSLLISLFGDPAQAVVPILGASGAIFGIFGALGAFYLLNRKELGINGRGAIGNWLFWLGINLLIGFMPGSNIAVWAHVGGLVAGVILAIVLLPRQRFFRR